MLHPQEEAAVAERFGVARTQVRRDHLISHLLAALSTHVADRVVFFGGTALSRTFAPDGRLSEDIDLIATGRWRDTAELIESALPNATRHEFPGLRWEPLLTTVKDAEPTTLTTPDGVRVRMQLLRAEGYPSWMDRAASRDLFDVWLLAQSVAIDEAAANLFARYGPTNRRPTASLFQRGPDEATWRRDLSGQTRLSVTVEQALTAVREAWGAVARS